MLHKLKNQKKKGKNRIKRVEKERNKIQYLIHLKKEERRVEGKKGRKEKGKKEKALCRIYIIFIIFTALVTHVYVFLNIKHINLCTEL